MTCRGRAFWPTPWDERLRAFSRRCTETASRTGAARGAPALRPRSWNVRSPGCRHPGARACRTETVPGSFLNLVSLRASPVTFGWARPLGGAHLRACASTRQLEPLFPTSAIHLSDWDDALPSAWTALPVRELYAPTELWPIPLGCGPTRTPGGLSIDRRKGRQYMGRLSVLRRSRFRLVGSAAL